MLEESGVYLGKTKNSEKVICPDDAKHIFCAGTTGAGKTVVLSNFVKRACERNYPCLIVDGKGDIGNGSMMEIAEHFCKLYKKKLYVVNLLNPDQSTKYNPFHFAGETITKDMIINMTDWSEQHYKSNAERFIQRLIKLLERSEIHIDFETITNVDCQVKLTPDLVVNIQCKSTLDNLHYMDKIPIYDIV